MSTERSPEEMRVLVIDEDYRLAHRLEEEDARIRIELRSSRWLHDAPGILGRGGYDLVLWHGVSNAEDGRMEATEYQFMEHVRREYPNVPIAIILEPGLPTLPFALPMIELTSDNERLWPRLLAQTGRNAQQTTRSGTLPMPQGASFHHVVSELRDPQSGRLDAARIARLFGLRLTDVARLVGQKLPTLSRTPDAPSVQTGLSVFEQIAAALFPLAGSPERAKMWLNAPNPQTEGETPLKLIRKGEGDVVAQMLEDMLAGQPA